MSKYIDSVGLKIKLGKRLADDERRIKEIVKETIDSMPTIDIVHCKDCEHYVSDGGAIMLCEHTEIPTEDEYFCSYGERIEKQ